MIQMISRMRRTTETASPTMLLDTGISELAVRRSEYSRILRTGGIDALTRILDTKADQLLNE